MSKDPTPGAEIELGLAHFSLIRKSASGDHPAHRGKLTDKYESIYIAVAHRVSMHMIDACASENGRVSRLLYALRGWMRHQELCRSEGAVSQRGSTLAWRSRGAPLKQPSRAFARQPKSDDKWAQASIPRRQPSYKEKQKPCTRRDGCYSSREKLS